MKRKIISELITLGNEFAKELLTTEASKKLMQKYNELLVQLIVVLYES